MKRFRKDDTYHIVYENLHEFFTETNPSAPSSKMNSSNKSSLEDLKGDSSWRYGMKETRVLFMM